MKFNTGISFKSEYKDVSTYIIRKGIKNIDKYMNLENFNSVNSNVRWIYIESKGSKKIRGA